MADDLVRRSIDGRVMSLELNRPEKKNAINLAMYDALREGLDVAAADSAVRVVLIKSSGPDFTTGNDIADFALINSLAAGSDSGRPVAAAEFIGAIAAFEKPIVAAVPGLAVGVGLTMLLHCDAVYVEPGTRLSAPFVRLGLTPEAGSSLLLRRLLGHQRAYAIFQGAGSLSGQEAVTSGLALECAPAGEASAAAWRTASALAALPPAALRETKRLMRIADDLDAVMEREGEAFRSRLTGPECAEAFAAFAARRPADFSRF